MQVTVDIPDQLAGKFGRNESELAELLQSGLRLRDWVGASSIAREIIDFLASGPEPQAILAFHPSEATANRARQLLERNRADSLTSAEKTELSEMAVLDHFMTLLKARAFTQSKAG
jgi:hypothetical protein